MTDAVQRAVGLIAPILPAEAGHYSGTRPLYATVSMVDDYDDHSDNGSMLHHTTVQVDVWQHGSRPVAADASVQAALAGAGYAMIRAGGDTSVESGEVWHRISRDYDYAQELEVE